MSEYFDGPVEDDSGEESQIELLLGDGATLIDTEKLIEELTCESSKAMATMAKAIIAMGPHDMRILYSNLRKLCRSKSWDDVLDCHNKNVKNDNSEWFLTLLNMAMVGLNATVSASLNQIMLYHNETKDNDSTEDGPGGEGDL